MSSTSYADLRRHIKHKIVCAWYGDRDDPANIAVECETCGEVLLDFDKEEEE